jgi:hypothetical protein
MQGKKDLMDQRTVTYEVIVHKASLALAKGESLSMFTQKLREAAGKAIALKLNLTAKNCSVYMVETFADSAVFDVTKRPVVEGGQYIYAYYALKYSRKADGTFEFSDTTEVERVTSFQPKTMLDVATNTNKANKAELEVDDDEDEEKEELSKKDAPPGWTYTKKSLWGGVL